MDAVVAVIAPKEIRIKRVMERDNISREKVLEWMDRQLPQREVIRRATYVIINAIGDGFFLTHEEAEKWADEHRPDPPYPYFDTALEWMPVATLKPGLDGFYWARLKDSSVVRCSFDSQAGVFMDEGHPLLGIMAWTSGFYSFEEAQQADEYESTEE